MARGASCVRQLHQRSAIVAQSVASLMACRICAGIYLLAGEFGLLMSCIFLPGQVGQSPTHLCMPAQRTRCGGSGVGASGAIYGLIGAMFADFFLNWHNIRVRAC